ncbi:M15 family metallopeptidase [Vibrio sp. S9_S30]|uniref:M15 family metallopeptidase n=1 Tax=Vibrio sp. S9_S30 TaxID=2720226 RepID=UPI0016808ACF|nr:M15 family metallopeptidase [Vibrio sp. S9_S30]MBD1556019.1 M15 family metallopeptidase [Vibrio sp. S9_S30]
MTPAQLTGQTQSHLLEYFIGTQKVLAHPDAGKALTALHQAAKNKGFELAVASGFRSYERQKSIWNAKYSGQRAILDNHSNPIDVTKLSDEDKVIAILRWSALPGASRHHWGTDFDVYAKNGLPKNTPLLLEPWEYQTGHQQDFAEWVQEAMQNLGFFLPYDEDLGGVAIEPWHISYRSVASKNLASLTTDIIREALHLSPVEGQTVVLPLLDALYNRFIINVRD